MKIFSFWGGVQSVAALVLSAQKRIDFQTFLFCNVGIDSENRETLHYVHDIAFPFAVDHGLALIELEKKRNGVPDTIYSHILDSPSSIGIPVYMSGGAPGNRSCTIDYKVKVVEKWLREHDGYPAEIGIGFSLDEFRRLTTAHDSEKKRNVYPLLDLRLTREDCKKIIMGAGLPIPPKSSCWFCPFHSMKTWQAMRENEPETFEKAMQLEIFINEKRARLGSKDKVWLSRKLKPLKMATTDLTQLAFDDDFCDSGYCFL